MPGSDDTCREPPCRPAPHDHDGLDTSNHVAAIIARPLKKWAAGEEAAHLLPRSGLQFRVDADRKRAPRVDYIQDLLAATAMRGVGLIRQVESFEIHVEVLVDLVAGAEVHVRRGIHERGLGAELR